VGISTATTFNNLWHFSVGYNYFNEHYDDFLIYNYYYKSNDYVGEKIGPPVNLPGGYSSELYLGNNPNQYYSFSYYKSIWENDFEGKPISRFIRLRIDELPIHHQLTIP